MNNLIQNLLEQNKDKIENAYNKISTVNRITKMEVYSMDFYFKVINQYFDSISKIKENKILKSDLYFYSELSEAIEKADFCMRKPFRNSLEMKNNNCLPSSMRR